MEDLGIIIPAFSEQIKYITNGVIDRRLAEKGIFAIRYDQNTTLASLGFDSLDIMEIIIEIEGEVRFRVKNKKIRNIFTVGNLYTIFINANERR